MLNFLHFHYKYSAWSQEKDGVLDLAKCIIVSSHEIFRNEKTLFEK